MSEREPATIQVPFTEQQLELIDRVAKEWALAREQTVSRVLQSIVDNDGVI